MRFSWIDRGVWLRCLIDSVAVVVLWGGRIAAADQHWPLNRIDAPGTTVRGHVDLGNGVSQHCAVFDGLSLITVDESGESGSAPSGFTLSVWVNPYLLGGGQQMIVGKNRYSLDQRQWGVMIDRDDRIRLYLWQGEWVTVAAKEAPTPGRWHQVGILVRPARCGAVDQRRACRTGRTDATDRPDRRAAHVRRRGRRWPTSATAARSPR